MYLSLWLFHPVFAIHYPPLLTASRAWVDSRAHVHSERGGSGWFVVQGSSDSAVKTKLAGKKSVLVHAILEFKMGAVKAAIGIITVALVVLAIVEHSEAQRYVCMCMPSY